MSLCKKNLHLHFQYFSPKAHMNQENRYKETSFCTFHKASLTVEAVVVIPLVVAFLLTLVSFFHVLLIQMKVEEALIYTGRRVAVESCVVEDEFAQAASAQALLLSRLYGDTRISRFVEGGGLGVSLLGSSFKGEKIILHATYYVKLPISMFGVEGITLWSRNVFRKWIGDVSQEQEGEDGWVYLTPNGEVYHKLESCRALIVRVKKAFFSTIESIRGKNGQKYYACDGCVEKISEEDIVYFTDYGDKYHQRLNCRYIKRTVNKKLLSEVSDRRPCALCCGGKE